MHGACMHGRAHGHGVWGNNYLHKIILSPPLLPCHFKRYEVSDVGLRRAARFLYVGKGDQSGEGIFGKELSGSSPDRVYM